jgi:hypothetical protein
MARALFVHNAGGDVLLGMLLFVGVESRWTCRCAAVALITCICCQLTNKKTNTSCGNAVVSLCFAVSSSSQRAASARDEKLYLPMLSISDPV